MHTTIREYPGDTMSATATAPGRDLAERGERVSFARLLWVGPLTIVAALALNLAIKLVAETLNPSLARMPQLQGPLVTLTVEGAVAAIVVFAVTAWLAPRPIFWYRIIAVAALLVSLIPDVALAIGGAPRQAAMRLVGSLIALGAMGAPGPGAGGPPRGAPAGGGLPPSGLTSGMPLEQVLVLMLLHVATAAVCIVLLTTLTWKPATVTTRSEEEL